MLVQERAQPSTQACLARRHGLQATCFSSIEGILNEADATSGVGCVLPLRNKLPSTPSANRVKKYILFRAVLTLKHVPK